jgi:hypothetical protein
MTLADDAWERVIAQSQQAVRELALGLGGLQDRLEGACDALLSLASRELPETVREEFLALIATIMDIEDLERLSDAAAVTLAEHLLAFDARVRRRS